MLNLDAPLAKATPDAPFALFYERHRWAVVNYLFRKLQRWEDAEDLAQVAFSKALSNWDGCPYPPDSRDRWLLRIAANVAIDHYRYSQARCTTELSGASEVASGDDPARDAESAAIRACYQRALARLTDRQRDIAAGFFDGGSEREIALRLGLSVGTVKSTVHRVRQILREDSSLSAWAA